MKCLQTLGSRQNYHFSKEVSDGLGFSHRGTVIDELHGGIAEAEKQGLGFQETGLVAHSTRRNFSLELLIYPRIFG